jgi:hypothetical protein
MGQRPAVVSGTGPTVAQTDCQKDDKDQDESQNARVNLRTCWKCEVFVKYVFVKYCCSDAFDMHVICSEFFPFFVLS